MPMGFAKVQQPRFSNVQDYYWGSQDDCHQPRHFPCACLSVTVFLAYSTRPSVHIFCSISWYVPLQTPPVALPTPLSSLVPTHSHVPSPSSPPASSLSTIQSSTPSVTIRTYSSAPPTASAVSWSASHAPAGRARRTWPCSHTAHSVTADTSPHTSVSPSSRCHSRTPPGLSSARPCPRARSRPGT